VYSTGYSTPSNWQGKCYLRPSVCTTVEPELMAPNQFTATTHSIAQNGDGSFSVTIRPCEKCPNTPPTAGLITIHEQHPLQSVRNASKQVCSQTNLSIIAFPSSCRSLHLRMQIYPSIRISSVSDATARETGSAGQVEGRRQTVCQCSGGIYQQVRRYETDSL
jgi:hypothetical protein